MYVQLDAYAYLGLRLPPHFPKASQSDSPAAAISNLEKSRPNFHSWQTRMHTSHAYQYTHTTHWLALRWRPGWSACRVDSKVRALGPHVAVRDSPYPVAHPACLAGVDGRHRKRHRRDQDPSRPRRVLQMGWLGTSRGRRRVVLSFGGGAMTLVVCFTMVLVATPPPSATVADRVPLGV